MLLIKYTLIEHTTIKYYKSSKVKPLLDAYTKIKEKDLPCEFDKLLLDSFSEFPLHIIKNKKLNELHLYTSFKMSIENFMILLQIDNSGGVIFFHKNGKQYEDWYVGQKRIKAIENILV